MTTVRLLDKHARDDLELFALRTKRLDEQAVIKIEMYGRAIAAYTAPLFASGLHDAMPTVIGVRTFPILGATDSSSATLTVSELLRQLTTMRRDDTLDLELSGIDANAVWLAITPPHTGWERMGGRVRQRDVKDVCSQGVHEVTEAVSEVSGSVSKVGALAVQKVRGRIWSEQPTELLGAPSGVAFVADGLGFLRLGEGDNIPTVAVFKHHHWYRLSFPFGEVLTHSRFL